VKVADKCFGALNFLLRYKISNYKICLTKLEKIMKTKLSMLLLIFLIIGGMQTTSAQVTIGSGNAPNENALLDLKEGMDGSSSRGLLMPRVVLEATNLATPLAAHIAGMTVYNTSVSPGGTAAQYYVSPGFYYNDGTKWERLRMGVSNWFYMPSVEFDTSATKTGVEVDLYEIYSNQFSVPVKSSTGAPAFVPYVPQAEDLYYYITNCDASVFKINSISAAGIMNYDVTAAATDCSYINIVFVLK